MSDAHLTATAGRGTSAVRAWAAAARLPFTSVAVVPFGAGAYLAWANGAATSVLVPALGIVAVFLICVGCYLTGEVYDQREDVATLEHGRTPFSGGSLMVANGTLSRRAVLGAAIGAFGLAAGLGIAIFALRRDPLLLGLGAFGLAVAAVYSAPPVRLVSRGFGELFIGVCYGWLTLATGYACAAGALPRDSAAFSVPVALTVFNIILINEFPDYEADRGAGKRNLLVRVGRGAGSWIYAAATAGTAASILWIWHRFAAGSGAKLAVALAVAGLALGLGAAVVVFRRWRDNRAIQPVCGLTIVLNLLSAVAVGALVRWP